VGVKQGRVVSILAFLKIYLKDKLLRTKIFLFTNIFILLVLFKASAQGILSKQVSVNAERLRLADVLARIGKQGDFYFSYNGNMLPKDSLVSIAVVHQPVASVLTQLFHGKFEFEEQGNYLIIIPALPHLTLVNTDITNENNTYSISGIVADEHTGERIMNASVYEKQQLAATLTDEHGYFKLKIRTANPGVLRITASKMQYHDVMLNFLQSVPVTNRSDTRSYTRTSGNGVERDALGKFFISARQRIQSLNIPDFFAKRPFQVSLTPGLSTHGLFSSQVVNKVSLNLAGGYTAGVNGMEIGGLFNINKDNSKYLQFAGVFNLVGGTMSGLQFAGINNRVLDTVKGIQFAVFNNKAEGQVSGLQFAGFTNEAHKLKGLQIGLVNVADTSYGASIGLINIIRNGFYRVALAANPLVSTNLSLSSGTRSFYTVLSIGANADLNNKMFVAGLGLGHDFILNDKFYLASVAEFQFGNTSGQFTDSWIRGKLFLHAQLTKHISIFAGPTYNNYTSSGSSVGYQSKLNAPVNKDGYEDFMNVPVRSWISVEGGIAFNSVFKAAKIRARQYASQSWYLGAAAVGGVDMDFPTQTMFGAEFFTQRDFNGHLAATFSAGYTQNIAKPLVYTFMYQLPNGAISELKREDFKAIPIKAGMRTYAGKNFFYGGEIGLLLALNTQYSEKVVYPDGHVTNGNFGNPPKSFIYAAGAGYSFDNGLEAGVKYEAYVGTGIKQALFRLGYRFKLN